MAHERSTYLRWATLLALVLAVSGDGASPDGNDQIFISLASFRDALCPATITNALARASKPERVVFGVVDQSFLADLPCLGPAAQVRREWVSPFDARGPTWARHRAELLYRGERWAMQMDAHMLFAQDWDTNLVAQWTATANEMAVLTAYPQAITGALDPVTNRSLRDTTPVMCSGKHPMVYTEPFNRLPRFQGASEIAISAITANIGPEPMLHPFFAAGLSFSAGHRMVNVPYDAYTPNLFIGEEIAMTVRLWTSGYDLYAFSSNVAFHVYPSERESIGMSKPPFFDQVKQNRTRAEISEYDRLFSNSTVRVRAQIQWCEGGFVGLCNQSNTWYNSLPGNYTLGSARDLATFWNLTTIQTDKGSTMDICRAVLRGRFHRELMPFRTYQGINYSAIPPDHLKRIQDKLTERWRCKNEFWFGMRCVFWRLFGWERQESEQAERDWQSWRHQQQLLAIQSPEELQARQAEAKAAAEAQAAEKLQAYQAEVKAAADAKAAEEAAAAKAAEEAAAVIHEIDRLVRQSEQPGRVAELVVKAAEEAAAARAAEEAAAAKAAEEAAPARAAEEAAAAKAAEEAAPAKAAEEAAPAKAAEEAAPAKAAEEAVPARQEL